MILNNTTLSQAALGFIFALMTSPAIAQHSKNQQSVMIMTDSIASGFSRAGFRLPLLESLGQRGCTIDIIDDQASGKIADPQLHKSAASVVKPVYSISGDGTLERSPTTDQESKLQPNVSLEDRKELRIPKHEQAHHPDFVLLHVGTTNLHKAIIAGMSTTQAVNTWANQTSHLVEASVDQILGNHHRPADVRVLVANFIPYAGLFDDPQRRDIAMEASRAYSQALESMVTVKADARVLTVDVATGFDTKTMLHPYGAQLNSIGEQHMAGAFLPVLKGAGLCPTGIPGVTFPPNGSLVSGESVTIDWTDNGLNAEGWRIYVGETQSGNSSTYFDSGVLEAADRSVFVSGLPEDRSNVVITLSYKSDGIWDLAMTSFISELTNTKAALENDPVGAVATQKRLPQRSESSIPGLISPKPGSQLPGSDVIFEWTDNGVPLTQWYLRVGRSKGASEFAEMRIENPDTRQLQVRGLPDDGSTSVFVQFSYFQGENWIVRDFEYLAADSASQLGKSGQSPVARNDVVGPTDVGGSITFPVVDNDSDSDGVVVPTSVLITAQPSYGKATTRPDGQIRYEHDGTSGTVQDVIQYTVLDNDGNRSRPAAVRIFPFKSSATTTTISSQPPSSSSQTLAARLLRAMD